MTGIFIITTLGYMLGKVTIKGVSLGTAGVFLVAIAFGMLCSIKGLKDVPVLGSFFLESTSTVTKYYKSVVSNVGLVMFVASVGFIAGPNFFKDLKRNFKTYILMGVIIIFTGALVAVVLSLTTPYGSEFWSGVLSGALTSTPGYSAAIEAAKLKGTSDTLVTVGHAIAYPFGVIGVVLFVQLLPKFLPPQRRPQRSSPQGSASRFRRQGSRSPPPLRNCASDIPNAKSPLHRISDTSTWEGDLPQAADQ